MAELVTLSGEAPSFLYGQHDSEHLIPVKESPSLLKPMLFIAVALVSWEFLT